MSLSRVLEEYYTYKAEESDNGLRTRIDRLRKDLILSLGKNRFEWTELKDLTRADANAYRDLLLSRMAPNSVQRNLGVVKAAINHVLLEHDLDLRNVFQAIKIKGAGSSSTDRLPITDEQLALITPAFASSDVAKALLLLLTDTGARLAEITGLEAKDVDLDKAILHIRPNDRRGLKTKTSTRSIPLSQRATECLRQHQVGLSDTDPIFPTYAKPRGSDSASAMLMKRLRTVITDKKITMHSLRHRMKDKLRNSGCPENLSMEILGHSQGSVAANYGSGYAIDVMREALVKVWRE
jgi:integrase